MAKSTAAPVARPNERTLYTALFVTLASAFLFSLLCASIALDLSLAAFPLSLCFTLLIIWQSLTLRRTDDIKTIPIIRKLLQYLPYALLASFVLRRAGKNGTPHWYDALTVLLWCAVFVSSLVALHYLNEKRVYALKKSWKSEKEKRPARKPAGVAWLFSELLDWIDALVQAVFMVLLIQIFIVQLYVIPSESMVPQFLVGDRVIVFKTASGPKFPLSDVGIPAMRDYKRGDVVVFRNPHYNMDRQSEIKTVVSQLVYMLTFMAVNLNTDENGQPKADPLVKNVVGVPGEQLVMQDGVLYARTKDAPDFTPVEKDAELACWNLNALDADTRRRIEYFPFSQAQYDLMLKCEAERRALNLDEAAADCRNLAARFNNVASSLGRNVSAPAVDNAPFSLSEYNLFANFDSHAQRLLLEEGGAAWFERFVTSWISSMPTDGAYAGGDIYSDANWRLNVMIKRCFAHLVVRYAELINGGATTQLRNDEELRAALDEAEMLNFYVAILDQRNMPVFPENAADGSAQYIPENCYFMVGANRFNSLDMRHSYSSATRPLTTLDAYSVTYESNISPQYVDRRYILGTTAFRFWPLDRIGVID